MPREAPMWCNLNLKLKRLARKGKDQAHRREALGLYKLTSKRMNKVVLEIQTYLRNQASDWRSTDHLGPLVPIDKVGANDGTPRKVSEQHE